MMTASELAKYLNKTGLLKVESIKVPVTVTDARTSFGDTHLLISPVGGEQSQWVAASRVQLL